MSAPASASRTTASTPDVAGPRVHISLVRGASRPSAPLGAGLTGSPPGSLPALDRRVGQRVRDLPAPAGPCPRPPPRPQDVRQPRACQLGQGGLPRPGYHPGPPVPTPSRRPPPPH